MRPKGRLSPAFLNQILGDYHRSKAGMTHPGRLRDLADVQQLIRHLGLGSDTADRLDPFVHDKFGELWRGVNENRVEP